MAPKMHAGKKQSRRMKGGMTTGEWGTAVFGGSDSQQAVGDGSNVIRMHDPNSVVAPPQMKGGRKLKGGDLGDYIPTIPNPFGAAAPEDASAPAAPSAEDAGTPSPEAAATPTGGIMDQLSDMNPFASTEAPATPATGGKGKRATKRRKSHKKKGKSSKKRAHKRR
jgi:hypothetical protein